MYLRETCFWARSSFFAVIYRKLVFVFGICKIQEGKREEKGLIRDEGRKETKEKRIKNNEACL